MKIIVNVAGEAGEIAAYLRHIADQIEDGFTSGYEGSQGNAWSMDDATGVEK